MPVISTYSSGTMQSESHLFFSSVYFVLLFFPFPYHIIGENVVSAYWFGDEIVTLFYILDLVMSLLKVKYYHVNNFLKLARVFTIFLSEIVYSTNVLFLGLKPDTLPSDCSVLCLVFMLYRCMYDVQLYADSRSDKECIWDLTIF